MDVFKKNTFALMYYLDNKSFEIHDVGTLVNWTYELFESLRDGERIFAERKDVTTGRMVVIVQIAENEDLLKDSQTFCTTMRAKHLSVEEIRSYLQPVRLKERRQHLPPSSVSVQYYANTYCNKILVLWLP